MYCTHFVTYVNVQSDINIVYCFNLSKYLLPAAAATAVAAAVVVVLSIFVSTEHNNSFWKIYWWVNARTYTHTQLKYKESESDPG